MTRCLYSAALMATGATLARGAVQGVSVCAAVYVATSVEQAREIAMAQCAELFPAAEGYRLHRVSVLPVPPLWYTLRPHMKRERQKGQT